MSKARRKRYHERLRKGRFVLLLEVDATVLALFIRVGIATPVRVSI